MSTHVKDQHSAHEAFRLKRANRKELAKITAEVVRSETKNSEVVLAWMKYAQKNKIPDTHTKHKIVYSPKIEGLGISLLKRILAAAIVLSIAAMIIAETPLGAQISDYFASVSSANSGKSTNPSTSNTNPKNPSNPTNPTNPTNPSNPSSPSGGSSSENIPSDGSDDSSDSSAPSSSELPNSIYQTLLKHYNIKTFADLAKSEPSNALLHTQSITQNRAGEITVRLSCRYSAVTRKEIKTAAQDVMKIAGEVYPNLTNVIVVTADNYFIEQANRTALG